MSKITYKDSGVNIESGYETVRKIKDKAAKTFTKNVLTGLGSFAGMYQLDPINNPVLVTGTDGVGTKLILAQMMDKHDTVGQDLVAMCVNDVLCHGAKPLFFLDYVASGKIVPDKMAEVVGGIADACLMAGLSLIGGETAEMPGMYSADEYDLAGFVVGIVDKEKIINGADIKPGDRVIGIAASGPHSNGFSLIRKVFFDAHGYAVTDVIPPMEKSIGDVLIEPTAIYTETIMGLMKSVEVKGIANITGGGFIENIPRTLPDGMSAKIYQDSWEIPPVFSVIQKLANLEDHEIYNTLNMGIGMVVVVKEANVVEAIQVIESTGHKAYEIGEIVSGDEGVILW